MVTVAGTGSGGRVRKLDYAGGAFGRPDDAILHDKLMAAWSGPAIAASAVPTLNGQDSVTAGDLTLGLDFYGYYAVGAFENAAQVRAHVGSGKKFWGVTPAVVGAGTDCLDVEPGDATPADVPNYLRVSTHPNTQLPMIYCSAGDAQACINEAAAHGYARGTFLLVIAHWNGVKHICAPGVCGYPQADGTQYASNNQFDSDCFYAHVWAPVPAPAYPLAEGMTDVVATGLVHQLQGDLNRWRVMMGGKFAPLVVDGDFGGLTKAAVVVAQAYFGDRGTPGTASSTFVSNNLARPVPFPDTFPSPTGLVTAAIVSTGALVTLTWKPVGGAVHYIFQLEGLRAGQWILLANNYSQAGTTAKERVNAGSQYRWRVAANTQNHEWSDWVEFTTHA